MNTTLTFSPYQLIEFFKNEVKHATPISVSALTKADCRDNPFGCIWKLNKMSAFTGVGIEGFEAAVRRREERERGFASFVAGPRAWGHYIAPGLIGHKGQHYIPLHVLSARHPVYMVKKALPGLELEMPLMPVAKELIESFLNPGRPGPMGVTKRDVRIDHVTAVAVLGRRIRVRHD